MTVKHLLIFFFTTPLISSIDALFRSFGCSLNSMTPWSICMQNVLPFSLSYVTAIILPSYQTSKLPKFAIIPVSLMQTFHLIFTGSFALGKFVSRCFPCFPKIHVVLQPSRRIQTPLSGFSKSFFIVWKDISACVINIS